MFGLSMMEVMVILVVALLVLGPNELPKAAKSIGKTLRDVRRASDDLRDTFEREVMSEKKPPQIRKPDGETAARTPVPDAIIGANAPPPELPPVAATPAVEPSPPAAVGAPAESPPPTESARLYGSNAPVAPPVPPVAAPVPPPVTLPEPPPLPSTDLAGGSFSLGEDPFASPPGGRRS